MRIIKIIWLFLPLIFMGMISSASSGSNCLYDKDGQKDGLWIEHISKTLTKYVYYKHGKEDGIIRILNALSSQLHIIGEMDNGEMCGTWMYFDDDHHLLMKCEDFHKVKTCIPSFHKYSIQFAPHNCYCTMFYNNGRIKGRGRLFFFEDPQMDDSGEYGIWEVFDEEGNLIKTVKYE